MSKSKTARQAFFDKQVHMDEWKNTMAGKNEEDVITAIEMCGYVLGKDFVRQYPMADAIVVDIAFVDEKLAIEVDGDNHLSAKQKKKDGARDRFLVRNNWLPFRINEQQFKSNPTFFRHLIKELVNERRKQLKEGLLYEIDMPEFKLDNF